MDTYSRFESCLPLDSKSREAVERAFGSWIKEFRKPTRIISDRSSEFAGISSFGIHHQRTASYRPMDNGMIEKSHQELAKLSRIHKSTPDKAVKFLNDEDVMRSSAEIIPDFAKPDIKRMDSVLVYVERRGRAKDESPWIGPFLVEEILDARTLKLSDGSEWMCRMSRKQVLWNAQF
jgi:transposase InsO family protein